MNELNINLFEKYTQNQMSSTEKSAFEEALTTDFEFKSQFETFKTLNAGIRASVLQEKLSMIKSHASVNTHPHSSPTRQSFWRSYGLYGILILALIGIIFFYLDKTNKSDQNGSKPLYDQKQEIDQPSIKSDTLKVDTLIAAPLKELPQKNEVIQKTTKNEIYAQGKSKNYLKEALSVYTAPANFAVILRDSQSFKDKTYAEALQMYENKNYQDAIKVLRGLDDEKSAYLLAHCYLLSGQHQEAAAIFSNMAENDFSSYYQESKWYLAISLLADYPKTKSALDEVIKSLETDPKQQNSLKILKSKIK